MAKRLVEAQPLVGDVAKYTAQLKKIDLELVVLHESRITLKSLLARLERRQQGHGSRDSVANYDQQTKVRELEKLIARRDYLETSRYRIQRRWFPLAVTREPWRLLPIEILGDIFLIAQEEYMKHSSGHMTFPTHMSLVCSKWRAVALMTPRLWACIPIHSSFDELRTKQNFAMGIRTARIWLKRSRSSLVYLFCRIDQRDQKAALEILNFIARHVDIIDHLHIEFDIDNKSLCNEVIQALKKPAPSLRSFTLEAMRTRITHGRGGIAIELAVRNAIASVIFNNQSPNLRSLTAPSSYPTWPTTLTENLANLVLSSLGDGSTLVQLLQLLGKAPRLISFSLTNRVSSWSSEFGEGPAFSKWSIPPIKHVTLPALEYARFNGNTTSRFAHILHYLHLPKLRLLHLECTSVPRTPNYPLPAHLFHSLETLELVNAEANSHFTLRQYIPALLRHCPNISQLQLRGSLHPLDILSESYPPSAGGRNQQHPCAQLIRLCLIKYQLSDRNETTLRKFLKGRMDEKMVASIETLSFEDGQVKFAVESSYRDLVKEVYFNVGKVAPVTLI